jgi:hypothetical protein
MYFSSSNVCNVCEERHTTSFVLDGGPLPITNVGNGELLQYDIELYHSVFRESELYCHCNVHWQDMY